MADLKDFQNERSMLEAANTIFAVGTLLRIAMGEVCSVNTLTGETVFGSDSSAKLVGDFDKVFVYLSRAYEAYMKKYNSYLQTSKDDPK